MAWIRLGVLVLILVVVRLMLATRVAAYVNRGLDCMGDYHGELASVALH